MPKLGSFVERALAFLRRAWEALVGKKGLITTLSIGLAAMVLTAASYLTSAALHGYPCIFQTQEFQTVRRETLATGNQVRTYSTISAMRTDALYERKGANGVNFSVAPSSDASDYYEVSFDTPWSISGRDYLLRTFFCNSTLSLEMGTDGYPFTIEVLLMGTDGDYPRSKQGIRSVVKKYYQFDTTYIIRNINASNRRGILDAEEWERCQVDMDLIMGHLIDDLPGLLEKAGFSNGQSILDGTINVFESESKVHAASYAALPLGAIGVVALSLFIGTFIAARARKKKGESAAAAFDPIHEIKEGTPDEAVRKPPKPLSRRSLAISGYLDRHLLRPFLGEWFFRGFGLVFVAVSSLFLSLFARLEYTDWGEGWNTFSLNWSETFRVFSSLGSIMLIVMVVGVITETRRNLNVSAWFFLTLAGVYYAVANSLMFSAGLATSRYGEIYASSLALSLPGNVFLGIGIYAILGFFLFFDPSERVINRKLFRSLSLIPIALTVVSVIFTYHIKNGDGITLFWLQNLVFIRSVNLLFVGVLYELAVFFFYRGMARRRGSHTTVYGIITPYFQFQKNIALCILIGLLVAVFYLIPADKRAYFGIETEHAFYYVLIPFFLFYLPGGRSHSAKSDRLYYLLYAIAWALPSIPSIIDVVSSWAN